MIEVKVTDHRTGKVQTFHGTTALVLVREGDEAEGCVVGEEDRAKICEMIEAAHDQVIDELDTPDSRLN
jgi:hypothetical protein